MCDTIIQVNRFYQLTLSNQLFNPLYYRQLFFRSSDNYPESAFVYQTNTDRVYIQLAWRKSSIQIIDDSIRWVFDPNLCTSCKFRSTETLGHLQVCYECRYILSPFYFPSDSDYLDVD